MGGLLRFLIVAEMTCFAIGRCLLVWTAYMTVYALQTAMPLSQGEVIVINGRASPIFDIMALCAFGNETRLFVVRAFGCFVIRQVTRFAIVCRVLEQAVHMTLSAQKAFMPGT